MLDINAWKKAPRPQAMICETGKKRGPAHIDTVVFGSNGLLFGTSKDLRFLCPGICGAAGQNGHLDEVPNLTFKSTTGCKVIFGHLRA